MVPSPLLKRHLGTWKGTYTHIDASGQVTDKHACQLEIGIRGKRYTQRNTYIWDDGRTEVWDFPGYFDENDRLCIDSPKIEGYAVEMDADTMGFYGVYKGTPEVVDTWDLLRLFSDTHRYRTWQVRKGDGLLKIVHVEENKSSSDDAFKEDMHLPEGSKGHSFI